MPRPSPWTPEAISALGYTTDREVAEMIGVSVEAVRQKRERLGIPSSGAPRGPAPARGEASRTYTIRLTPADVEAFTRAAGGKSWRSWLADVGRKAIGIK